MDLLTERLELTEIAWIDLENIHRLQSDYLVDEFNTVGLPKNIEETKMNIEPYMDARNDNPQSKYTWNLKINDTKEFIGLAGIKLSLDKFKIGEIFYKLSPEYWGKGYATEVSMKLVEIGFEKFNLHRIEAGCAVNNIKSIKVLEKSGMTREGIHRKLLPIRGEWVDCYIYSVIEEEKYK